MLEWLKEHPYLAGGGLLAIIILFVVIRNASASNSSQPQVVSTGPDDSIQSMEIQAGAAIDNAQLQAQTTVAQTNAAVQLGEFQSYAGTVTNNQNTQAGLTLGLAQSGQGTQSILELLAAQPGSNPSQVLSIIPGVSNTPATTAPAAPVTSPTQSAVTAPSTQPVPVQIVQPTDNSVVPTGGAASGDNVSLDELDASAHETGLYDASVSGQGPGGAYQLNPQYYSSAPATQALGQILGVSTAVGVPSGLGGTATGAMTPGSPFQNPPAGELVVTQGAANGNTGGPGLVDAGQITAELQALPQGQWGTILAGYGIQDTPAINTELNQLINGETQGSSTTQPGA